MRSECELNCRCFIPKLVNDWRKNSIQPTINRALEESLVSISEQDRQLASAVVLNPVRSMNYTIINSNREILSTERRGALRYSTCDRIGIGADRIHFSFGIPYVADRFNPEGSREFNRILLILKIEELKKRRDYKIFTCDSGYLYMRIPPLSVACAVAEKNNCGHPREVPYKTVETILQMGLDEIYRNYLLNIDDASKISMEQAQERVAHLFASIRQNKQNHRVFQFPEGSVSGSIDISLMKQMIVPEHLYEEARSTFTGIPIINAGPVRTIILSDNGGFVKTVAIHLLEAYFTSLGVLKDVKHILDKTITQIPNFY